MARYVVAVSAFALITAGSVGALSWWLARDFKIYIASSTDDAPAAAEEETRNDAQVVAALSGPEQSVGSAASTAAALSPNMEAVQGADKAQRPRYAIVLRAKRSVPGEETGHLSGRDSGRTVGELISRSLHTGF